MLRRRKNHIYSHKTETENTIKIQDNKQLINGSL